MWDLLDIHIHSVPLGSFLAMLVAFWSLGAVLMRGVRDRRKMAGRPRKVTAL